MTELLPDSHPLAVEINVTRLYRAHQHAHPSRREAEALAGQFPAALHLPAADDLLCGRAYLSKGVLAARRRLRAEPDAALELRIPAVGFAALRPADGMSAPWFWDRPLFERKLDLCGSLPAELATEGRELIAFWDAEDPARRCWRSFSPEVKRCLPMHTPFGCDPALPLIRMTGFMPDWSQLLDGGLPGLRARLTANQAEDADPEFLAAAASAIDRCVACLRWYANGIEAGMAAADPPRATELARMASDCRYLTGHAPASLAQAMQLLYLWAVLGTTFQFARLDDALGHFLAADLQAGRIDEDQALALIRSLWRLIHDCGAEFDNRVVIGGAGRRHSKAADQFARLAIEATRTEELQLPQLSLRLHADQDPELYQLALTSIGEGRTFPILYNDVVNIPAVMRAFDVPRQLAEQYVPYGCGEYVLAGQSFGTPSGAINLAMVLDLTLRGGRDAAERQILPPGPRLPDMRDFEECWLLYRCNASLLLERLADQQKQEYDFVAGEAGYLFWSLIDAGSMRRGRPLFSGGIDHLGGTMESYGQINAADSLHAIKRLVFDERSLDPEELLRAMDEDFVNHEPLRQRLLNIPKYGNDDAKADAMAVRVHEQVCHCTRDQAKRVGLDSFLVVIINNQLNTNLGHHTGATADGRRAGMPLANANNPQPGADHNGLTAMLSSLLKLDPSIHAGAVQNCKFTPRWFQSGRPLLEAVLTTWWRGDGSQLMLTVVDRAQLEEAQREPEKHGNLLVRVGGFTARFVELDASVQNEVIARTLNA